MFAREFIVAEYNLAATLSSGQAFRWRLQPDGSWMGVIGDRWIRLRQVREKILAETATDPGEWRWLADYLQLEVDLRSIIETFPDDENMRRALAACRGLRLLRQEPWECLASFILSSTKQIVQIQQIVQAVSDCYGRPLATPTGVSPISSFPSAAAVAARSEEDLRRCKMGFRAPYLLGAARMVMEGSVALQALRSLPLPEAREQLLRLPGVGRKIADCVLLFAYGFPEAFPIDVWVVKALRQLYFRNRRVKLERLQRFSSHYFGPNAGYAQQYLFHYMRVAQRDHEN